MWYSSVRGTTYGIFLSAFCLAFEERFVFVLWRLYIVAPHLASASVTHRTETQQALFSEKSVDTTLLVVVTAVVCCWSDEGPKQGRLVL